MKTLAPATAALSDSGESPEAESDAESPMWARPCGEAASPAPCLPNSPPRTASRVPATLLAVLGGEFGQSGGGTVAFFKGGNAFGYAVFADGETRRTKTGYKVSLA